MKVLQFIECSEPGGAERVVVLINYGLRNLGITGGVLVLKEGWLTEQLRKDGLEPIVITSAHSYDLLLPLRIAAEIRRFGADLIHTHLLDANFYGALAAKLAGVPHVATDHGDVHLPQGKKLLKFKLKTASILGTQFTGVSKFTCAKLTEYGVSGRRPRCIYNPVVTITKPNSATRHASRAAVGVADERDRHWIWIHVGLLKPVKDQHTLLTAFALAVAQSTTKMTLLVVGDGPERRRLELLAVELKIGDCVKFLGIRDDVPELLSACDGFILSSVSEALPMSILEAGTAGLVVISSNVGGVSEVLKHEETGYLFSPGDVATLATLIARAVANQNEASHMAERAQEYFTKTFALSTISEQYASLYNDLL